MKNLHFTINGQKILFSFRQLVANKCGGLDNADRIFWRCRHKKTIIRYISAGMAKGWFISTNIEQDYTSKAEVEAWIDEHIRNIKPDKKKRVERKAAPKDLGSLIGDILKGI
jgi:hypothetical protein